MTSVEDERKGVSGESDWFRHFCWSILLKCHFRVKFESERYWIVFCQQMSECLLGLSDLWNAASLCTTIFCSVFSPGEKRSVTKKCIYTVNVSRAVHSYEGLSDDEPEGALLGAPSAFHSDNTVGVSLHTYKSLEHKNISREAVFQRLDAHCGMPDPCSHFIRGWND